MKLKSIIIGVIALLIVVGGVNALTLNGTPEEIKSLVSSEECQLNLGAAQQNDFWASEITATTTTTTAGEASIVLYADSGRRFAILTNTTATIAYLAFNATTTPNAHAGLAEVNYAIPLAASGGTYTINYDNLYFGQIIATSSAAVTIRALSVN